jgi:small-conductance mechanosensitive channel
MSFYSNFYDDIVQILLPYANIIYVLIIIAIVSLVFGVILKLVKRRLLKNVKSKEHRSTVTMFIDLLKYTFLVFLFIVAVSLYAGKLGDLGFIAGLLTVALGWALQRPISGVVAWLIIVTRRPFHVEDYVSIRKIEGVITNITLSHIIIDEVGGTIDGKALSGRTVMVPTSVIFEEEVINFTEKDEFIIDEVAATITYDSNLLKAEGIMKDAVTSVLTSLWSNYPSQFQKEPYTRVKFDESGVTVITRFHVNIYERDKVETDIRREIWARIAKTNDIEFAYTSANILLKSQAETIKNNSK